MNQTGDKDIVFESQAKAKGWSLVTRSFQGTVSQQHMPTQQTQIVSQFTPMQSAQSVS